MGKFVKGDVVVVPFPFSDLTANKKRPTLVVAALVGDDVNSVVRQLRRYLHKHAGYLSNARRV